MNNVISIDQEWQILSSLLPNGQFWRNKNNIYSNLGVLVRTFAYIMNKFRIYHKDLSQELIPIHVIRFVDLWEKFLGIPDEDFQNVSNDLNERIKIILIKLFGLQVTTRNEVINLVKLLYPQITQLTIQSGIRRCQFPLQFPIYFFANKTQATRYVFVTINNVENEEHFPLQFPIKFYTPIKTSVRLLLEALMPFSTKVILV